MKVKLTACCVLIITITIGAIHLVRLRNDYLNASSAQQCVMIAEVIKKYYIKYGFFPEGLFQDLSSLGMLSDGRGADYEIEFKDDGVKLQYRPKGAVDKQLQIFWKDGMGEVKITNSFSSP